MNVTSDHTEHPLEHGLYADERYHESEHTLFQSAIEAARRVDVSLLTVNHMIRDLASAACMQSQPCLIPVPVVNPAYSHQIPPSPVLTEDMLAELLSEQYIAEGAHDFHACSQSQAAAMTVSEAEQWISLGPFASERRDARESKEAASVMQKVGKLGRIVAMAAAAFALYWLWKQMDIGIAL